MYEGTIFASGRLRYTRRPEGAALHALNLSRDVLMLPSEITARNGDVLPLHEIAEEAFYQTTARCIVLPGTVERIGTHAFSNSEALQALYIPPSVKLIDRSSFACSDNLTLCVERGSYADRYARALNCKVSYGMPEDLNAFNRDRICGDWIYRLTANGEAVLREYMGEQAQLIIPAQVDAHDVIRLDNWCLDSSAFLEEVIVPEGVTSLGQECFGGCAWLTSVTMPDSVRWIGEGAFANCLRLKTLRLSDAIRVIPAICFGNCCALRGVTLPAELRCIGLHAFACCTSLQEIDLPPNVSKICYEAFLEDFSMKQITLNEGLAQVSHNAFNGCKWLRMPELPQSLPPSEWKAFRNCIGAEDVDWLEDPEA